MAKDNQVRMPSSMAGITQYFEDVDAKIMLSPKHVVILIIAVCIGVIALHMLA